MTPPEDRPFLEARLGTVPLQNLGLTIEGTPLQGVIDEFLRELEAAGIRKLRPTFYLSTEWGVNTGSIAIGMPFYLVRQDLQDLHEQRVGLVEGTDRADILRYLRHEMGHVVNYAYRLFESEEWVRLFGAFTQPYVDEYRPKPFSTRFVRHLPGWYAQKHPDEDWAETFAVWMTPGSDWNKDYTDWPTAVEKLGYCDRTLKALADVDPLVIRDVHDEDVKDLTVSVDEFYVGLGEAPKDLPRGIDGALRNVFDAPPAGDDQPARDSRPATELLRRHERELLAMIFRWTGHFPESTRVLLRHMARRAADLGLVYPVAHETSTLVALTTLITALAMNHVFTGSYEP